MSYLGPKQLWNDLMLIWENKKGIGSTIFDSGSGLLSIASEDNWFQVTYNSSNWEIGREKELTFLIEKDYNLVSMWGDDSDGLNFRIVGHYYGAKLTDEGVLKQSHKALCPVVRELKLLELGI
jgi:hypothetical protein